VRLPSFNDFSPELIPNIREILKLFTPGANIGAIHSGILAYAPTLTNLQRQKNVVITLRNLGLIVEAGGTILPTGTGEAVRDAADQQQAALAMCTHIILHLNGLALLRAIDALDRSSVQVTKKTLQKQLEADGITDLSNATTDHTTLANWMVTAGLLQRTSRTYLLSDAGMQAGLGFGIAGLGAMEALSEQQRIYVRELKRRSLTMAIGQYVLAGDIFDECAESRPALFDNQDQMRAAITDPLIADGWIELDASRFRGTGRGGKGGWIRPGPTLISIPVEDLLPQYLDGIPTDLRDKLATPLPAIKSMLDDPDKNVRGLGLELLALRMVVDLGLKPSGFRLRANNTTGGTEVDLVAEGRRLAFTRWTFQCKHTRGNVNVSQVAKEVGIATHMRSHVIVMVSTAGFSGPAMTFAAGVTKNTPLQFVMVKGEDLQKYLRSGADWLAKHVERWVERNATIKALGDDMTPPADDES
jgi:hypothetical protein